MGTDSIPPDLRPGDKVSLDYCPSYPSLETHRAKVVGFPVWKDRKWVVPISYWCTTSRKISNYPCEDLVKLNRMKISPVAITFGIMLGLIAFIALWFMANYNSLVSSRNQVDKSWASVETQYQRRFDIIGNVVESVKGSQIQEREVFGRIADARKQYQNSSDPSEKAQAASTMETNLAVIPRLQEAYPELKSNEQVTTLMNELKGTENGILSARDGYNNTATNYNTNVQRFPKNMFANMFGFKPYKLFRSDAAAANRVDVKF